MPLTEVQLRVDRWSKIVLFFSTILMVYSTGLFFATSHHDHHPHHSHMMHRGGGGHHHQHGSRSHSSIAEHREMAPEHGHHRHHHQKPVCAIHRFAILGMVTSLTGIFSAFKGRRAVAMCFLILVLITEFLALGAITAMSVKAVQQCKARNTHELIAVDTVDMKMKHGSHSHEIKAVVARDMGPVIDEPGVEHCDEGVRHASVLGCLIIGVIACGFACCASKHATALAELEVEDNTGSAPTGVVVEVVLPAKEQPAVPVEMAAVPTLEKDAANCTGSPALV